MITHSQAQALLAYARANGRTWKAKLREDWLSARCPEGLDLRALRNNDGPSFLEAVRIDKQTGIIRHKMFAHGYFAVES